MRSGSSPLKMVEEEYAPSMVGSDLWDAASLGYPGLDDFEMDHEDVGSFKGTERQRKTPKYIWQRYMSYDLVYFK